MRISVNRRLVGVVAVATLGVLPLALLGPAAAAAKAPKAAKPSSGSTFNPNLLLQGSTNTAEPSIRTDRFGRPFVIGPTGVPAGCKAWRVTHDGSSATYIGQPDHTAGGGDCDWAIGPQETSATISWPDGRPAGSRFTRSSRLRTVRPTTPTRRWRERPSTTASMRRLAR